MTAVFAPEASAAVVAMGRVVIGFIVGVVSAAAISRVIALCSSGDIAEAITSAAADAILIGGIIAFVSAGVNAVKTVVRSVRNAKLIGSSQTGAQPCQTTNQCFKEGTLVETEEGLKPIEEIEVGDKVLAYDEVTGEQAYKPVVRLFRNSTEEWYHIQVNGEEIICTGGHPFYVAGLDKFIPASELKVGSTLLLSDGNCVITEEIKVEKLTAPETTYNFEVADFHTYYVSKSKILTHNKCGIESTSQAKVHGKAYGSAEHQARIMQEVKAMQASGKYSDIYLNKALKTVGLNGTQRPDIIGKLIDGSFDALEVASKTQISASLAGQQLAAKVALMQVNNSGLYVKPIIWLFG